MKTVSRKQVTELVARFATDTNWGALDYDALQKDVIDLSPEVLGQRLTAFLHNGCRLDMKGDSVLAIDGGTLPSPAQFFGDGWTIGEEDHDERSRALYTIDFSGALFTSPLRDGETLITGVEKLAREQVEDESYIRLDFEPGIELFREHNQATLRFIYDAFGVTWMEFTGTVLYDPSGNRFFLCLSRWRNGLWTWYPCWLGHNRDDACVSVRFPVAA